MSARSPLVAAMTLVLAAIAGCGGGGGGGGGSSSSQPPPVANAVALTVDAGPPGLAFRDVNALFTTVTVCVHGTATCRTVDHVLVDTGSTGLRIIASALPLSSSLSPQTDTGGSPLAECIRFADGRFVWGPVRVADIQMAGKQASSIPIQIIGDPQFPGVPAGCTGIPSNTVAAFGANGILGVGNFREDCGPFCSQFAGNGQYFACSAFGCNGVAVDVAKQVVHPVALFAGDNNGVVIKLPAIPSVGASTVTGSLIFGIGTQTNNALGTVKVFGVGATTGVLTTLFDGQTYPQSFFDSGSSALFLPLGVPIPVCPASDPIAPGYLCPPVTQHLSATIVGINGTTDELSFDIANADSLLGTGQLTAFSNLGAPGFPFGFDWGLPFFFGRTVFTAIENANTPGGTGPYIAY